MLTYENVAIMAGVGSGTFTAGARQTRTINTTYYNGGSIASLASNKVTLTAGTYEIEVYVTSYDTGLSKAWLYNASDMVDVADSMSQIDNNVAEDMTKISTVIEIGASTDFEVHHRCTRTGQFGAANSSGIDNVFLFFVARKLAPSGASQSRAILAHQETQNTNGATITGGAWSTRKVTTEVYDPDGLVTLAGNKFTLGTGTYEIQAVDSVYTPNQNQIRIYNTSDGISYAGMCGFAGAGAFQTSNPFVIAVVAITSAKAFEIQHYAATTAAFGFGVAANYDTEQYATIRIRKIA